MKRLHALLFVAVASLFCQAAYAQTTVGKTDTIRVSKFQEGTVLTVNDISFLSGLDSRNTRGAQASQFKFEASVGNQVFTPGTKLTKAEAQTIQDQLSAHVGMAKPAKAKGATRNDCICYYEWVCDAWGRCYYYWYCTGWDCY
jgi:hypothetical protein